MTPEGAGHLGRLHVHSGSGGPMFNRATTKGALLSAAGTNATCLGEGTHWQGEIRTGAGDLRVEGFLEGTVLSEGHVIIAPTGVVKGAIHARRLSVMGRAEGAFKVTGCLEILGTGWVEGDVELSTLVVDQGGTLQGSCLHMVPAASKEPVPFVPRREDRVPERPGHPASGTHGQPDFAPPGRGPGWMRP